VPASPDLVAVAAARAAAGDLTAVRFLYVRLLEDVIESVRDLAEDAAAARETADSVFEHLPRTIKAYEPRELPFETWLRAVARTAALERAGRSTPAELGEREPVAARTHVFREALWRMPSDQREVLVLRHLVGLSSAEIARRLGRTEESVRELHRNGRAGLRGSLSAAARESAVA
jgi:RNA polymerase sigma-70 factor, ECF subfamily